MNTFLIYLLKVAVYLAGFYLVYYLFLSRDTLYRRNRTVLLLSVILSLVMPFITVNIRESGNIFYFGKVLSEVFVTADGSGLSTVTARSDAMDLPVILFRIYLAGVSIFTFKLLIDIISLAFLIARRRESENHIVRFDGFNTAGFSAMGYIFINRSLTPDEEQEIIRHEQNHIDQGHFYDILLVEIIKVIQWFNPAIYMINRSLRAIHEYQADEDCLLSGMSIINYQGLLLNHIFRSKIFMPSNSFSNPSLIKKRMLMMTRVRTGNIASLKLILIFPVVILLLLVISACDKNIDKLKAKPETIINPASDKETLEIIQSPAIKPTAEAQVLPPPPPPPPKQSAVTEPVVSGQADLQKDVPVVEVQKTTVPTEIFVVVEEMPHFPGGDAALMEFIYANIMYPEPAKNSGIQGRVILRFAVMADGSVDKATVLKGVDESLDNEAIRVIRLLPRWTPGRQGGKPVNVWYSVPVTFQLKDDPYFAFLVKRLNQNLIDNYKSKLTNE